MLTQAPSTTADILLLSQDPAEVELLRAAARNGNLHVVSACGDVLPFLRREREYRDAPRPHLVLLDLDLQNEDDCDTLVQIKNDAVLRRIPLVVMAQDGSSAAVSRAYDLRANAYVRKPKDPGQFVKTLQAVLGFWFKVARLPGQND